MVLYYEAILDTYYEFQRDQVIACRFVSEIMKLRRLIPYDKIIKTKNMMNEFLRKKNDMVVNNLLEDIRSIRLDGVFFIEKNEDSNFCISMISSEEC